MAVYAALPVRWRRETFVGRSAVVGGTLDQHRGQALSFLRQSYELGDVKRMCLFGFQFPPYLHRAVISGALY